MLFCGYRLNCLQKPGSKSAGGKNQEIIFWQINQNVRMYFLKKRLPNNAILNRQVALSLEFPLAHANSGTDLAATSTFPAGHETPVHSRFCSISARTGQIPSLNWNKSEAEAQIEVVV